MALAANTPLIGDELIFYCETSGHTRTIHFKTDAARLLVAAETLQQQFVVSDYTQHTQPLTFQNANLPLATTSGYSGSTDSLTQFPFWVGGQYHWGIRGVGTRFECDDYTNDASQKTLHNIWYRATTSRTPTTSTAKTCSDLPAVSTVSGRYLIRPESEQSAIIVPCYFPPDGGPAYTILYAATGADNERAMTSDTAVSGNPLAPTLQAFNIDRAAKVLLSELSTETIFVRQGEQVWLKMSQVPFNQRLLEGGYVVEPVTIEANDGTTSFAKWGFTGNEALSISGGDVGLGTHIDHHNTDSYYNLNTGCGSMFLYSFSSASA